MQHPQQQRGHVPPPRRHVTAATHEHALASSTQMSHTFTLGPGNNTKKPPDSGTVVTPALLQDSHNARLDGLRAAPSASTQPTNGKLSADASEFVCFAVHRIWHRIPPRSPSSLVSPNYPSPPSAPSALPSPSASVISPPGTSHWYPAFFEAVHNVIHRANCSLPHILISLLYVARLRQAVPKSHTGEGSEFRVFVSALILAQKYHTDDRYANKTWSKMTGLPLNDVNTMEREFLTGVGGRLHVTREEYDKWLRNIQALGQEHSAIVRRARVEMTFAVGQEGQEVDPLRRVRTWPEREKVVEARPPPYSNECP
ncbi:uncharacterized protein SPPG_06244 [Spizellomyces punctatus DAOM BR117]|uniref:Cyclin N-terminal domain-containing protein n=1 Tax=Spizellomyces punctatus (strain DAOM BR117) TaxID=645134 RepID=A0A0L0HAG0_SPIPD|nr:uncharacterized protein SPPG_06244 [Spizellomyces punctatus DAOM BR117]KNC98555.1 hypothetical protein SPPG_06244 [Spizellomyces punctatus DAOM BR117]|eukprot:XP_016606595.1 hypothetical protein SPPG_06244 [Spizellomyces punctatus DAOM BR117]